jgi:hypothetical protein
MAPRSQEFIPDISAIGSVKTAIMDSISDFVAHVPQGVQWAFAGVGALFVGGKVLSYLQLLLNLFVLSGVNVSLKGVGLGRQ